MSGWSKAPEGPITEHFTFLEAVCHHCGRIPGVEVVVATAEWLENVRHILGDQPVHINSWCRCPTYNMAVGGAQDSYHIRGMAADITMKHKTPRQVHAILSKHQGAGKLIGGLGRYAGFVHCDRGPARRWSG